MLHKKDWPTFSRDDSSCRLLSSTSSSNSSSSRSCGFYLDPLSAVATEEALEVGMAQLQFSVFC
jgi:hypothetical protein